MDKKFITILILTILAIFLVYTVAFSQDYSSYIGKKVQIETRFHEKIEGKLIEIYTIRICLNHNAQEFCTRWETVVTYVLQYGSMYNTKIKLVPERIVKTLTLI